MQIVIYMQDQENYGIHDWDGQGEILQYWKYKDGSTYVVPGLSMDEVRDWESKHKTNVFSMLTTSSDSIRSWVAGYNILDDEQDATESWDHPWILSLTDDGRWKASRFVPRDVFWSPGYTGKTEQFILGPNGQHIEYKQVYHTEAE